MKNKITYLTEPFLPPFEEYVTEIKSIWDTHMLTNFGPKYLQLEEKVKEYLGIENVLLFTNGHSALEAVIDCMDLKGEIITTPFTFISTANAILRNKLKPVFCDIEKDLYTLDTSKVEKLITKNTSAILAVHVYGNACNIPELQKIADKNGLKIIYDAAHAFGVRVNSESISKFGDASMFSFHATKCFNTVEGGALVVKDYELYDKLTFYRNFGLRSPESLDSIGFNAKMSEFHAAMGLCNIRYLYENIKKRKKISEMYDLLLQNKPGIRLRKIQSNVESNYTYYPIEIDKQLYGKSRNEVYDILQANDIITRKYFYPNINSYAQYSSFSFSTPVADAIAENILCLPLHANLPESIVSKICNII